MDAYELMLQTNYRLIKGETLSTAEKNEIVKALLAAKEEKPAELKPSGKNMYPLFYIPPYKITTVLEQTPKTRILSDNMYELEILRLLCLFAPENEQIGDMKEKTLKRLKTTCFGYSDDGVGECFDASLVVLRFLIAAAPEESEWILSRIENYKSHAADKKRPWFSVRYYWLCLSELPFEAARAETDSFKDEIIFRLSEKSYVMNSETDKTLHPVLLSILRNLLSKYPEYAYLGERAPFVNEKDGRLYFDITRR